MSENTDIYKKVLSCFGYGRRNAMHMRQLAKLNQLSERELRKVIEIIRRSGICVVSDNSGYYFPETREEIESYIKRMERMAKSTFYTIKAARNELERIDKNDFVN